MTIILVIFFYEVQAFSYFYKTKLNKKANIKSVLKYLFLLMFEIEITT
jgi:hypothetical protein